MPRRSLAPALRRAIQRDSTAQAERKKGGSHQIWVYVDDTDADVLEERLQGCFRSMNRMDVNNVFTFSGGFVEWIDQILRRT